MSDTFNPLEWLPLEESDGDKKSTEASRNQRPDTENKGSNPYIDDNTELVISRIETAMTDITGTYDNWLKVGFAFADAFGEQGRTYFHRVSRFYPGYSLDACNKQYDQCLKSTGHGVTIKTFFGFAQDAGIDLRPDKPLDALSTGEETPEDDKPVELPTLDDDIFPELPQLLQEVITAADSKEERDILLLGSLACLSACLPNVFGYYDGKRLYANIFVFITAQASAGKGNLVFCKHLIKPVHWSLRKQTTLMKQEYDSEMREFSFAKGKETSGEKPIKPPELMLLIPANNSSTGMFQLLYENKGRGMIFETEGDTITQAFKSDFSNYSDGFRKAFPHEAITYYRRTDHEMVEIEHPCLSVLLSGTPKQVASLIPNAENGLFSRFIFYHMNIKPVWKNVFANGREEELEDHFLKLGKDVLNLYEALDNCPGIKFTFTDEQKDRFHQFFTQTQDKYLTLQSSDYMATIRRLGPIAFRIAMILTTLRIIETGDLSDRQVCSDADFNTALSIIGVIVRHASYVFSQLPEDVKMTKPKNKKEQFWDKLPERFKRKEYLMVGKTLSISERTALLYISNFCDTGLLLREQRDTYVKTKSLEGKTKNDDINKGI